MLPPFLHSLSQEAAVSSLVTAGPSTSPQNRDPACATRGPDLGGPVSSSRSPTPTLLIVFLTLLTLQSHQDHTDGCCEMDISDEEAGSTRPPTQTLFSQMMADVAATTGDDESDMETSDDEVSQRGKRR